MANFEVTVVKIDDVREHPNADRLTIVKIGGYECIANKKEDGSWRYHTGDLVVYIPEQAILPEWLLKKMGFWDEEKGKGGLAGSNGDRVKAMKLRNVFSQGILYPVRQHTSAGITNSYFETPDGNCFIGLGDNVTGILGITKYEPVIPTSMSGEVWNASGKTLKFDIENIQKYTEILEDGEPVVYTEKLHGTFVCFGIYVEEDGTHTQIVTSKGLGEKGLALKNNDQNASNLYVRTDNELNITQKMSEKMKTEGINEPVYVLGEIFGAGVQDLHYGQTKPTVRVFDVYLGEPGMGQYKSPDEVIVTAKNLGLEAVPELYRGPHSMEKVVEFRDGKDTISNSNVREGIVIRPLSVRNSEIGRVILKAVSPAYLTRKDGTEYN